MYECKILADSISLQNHRLTTFQVSYPRMIHSEVMTHRMLSRNGESSRARPVIKNIDDVRDHPFVPSSFGKNQPGMQWSEDLNSIEAQEAQDWWNHARDEAVFAALNLEGLGVHKSLANRVLEPYKWYTVILSGTDWANFFALRTDASAQPEFRTIAEMMREAYESHEPTPLTSREWHLPLITEDEIDDEARTYPEPFIDYEMWKKVSIGRCARVSYLTHDGKRDLEADIALYERLKTNGHLSPFEHVARPFTPAEWDIIKGLQDFIAHSYLMEKHDDEAFMQRLMRNIEYCGNYRGWHQVRADIPNEDDFSKVG